MITLLRFSMVAATVSWLAYDITLLSGGAITETMQTALVINFLATLGIAGLWDFMSRMSFWDK